jgi:hypothetical protein
MIPLMGSTVTLVSLTDHEDHDRPARSSAAS